MIEHDKQRLRFSIITYDESTTCKFAVSYQFAVPGTSLDSTSHHPSDVALAVSLLQLRRYSNPVSSRVSSLTADVREGRTASIPGPSSVGTRLDRGRRSRKIRWSSRCSSLRRSGNHLSAVPVDVAGILEGIEYNHATSSPVTCYNKYFPIIIYRSIYRNTGWFRNCGDLALPTDVGSRTATPGRRR